MKPAMALGLLALVLGVWAGLQRVGWTLPTPTDTLPAAHGPLMVTGFLGVLIGVERAVGLGRRPAFVAPVLLGAGTVAVLLPVPASLVFVLLGAGSAALLVVTLILAHRHPGVAAGTMALGVSLLLGGSLVWSLGRTVPEVVPWWIGFIVLFIAGERRELSRYLAPSRPTQAAFVASCGVLVAGVLVGLLAPDAGVRLAAAGLVFLGSWLLVHDIALRNLREPGLPGFTANALVAGYAWLGVAGLAAMTWGLPAAGFRYDFILHAVFLGFAFSMIFAHGPIIFPAIVGRPLVYTRGLYAPLALLHGSMVLRAAGDLAADATARAWGGLLSGVAIFAFLVAVATLMRSARD